MGIENGDMGSHHDYKSHSLITHHGHVMAVIRRIGEGPQTVTVTVDGVEKEQVLELD